MTPNLLRDLTESKLLPTYQHLHQYTAKQVAGFIYLYLCGLYILYEAGTAEAWVKRYCRRTIQYGNFGLKEGSGTDLYVMLHAISDDDIRWKHEEDSEKFVDHVSVDVETVIMVLRDMASGFLTRTLSQKLFLNLDTRLRISDSELKSIRRLAMNWSELTRQQQRLTMTQLRRLFHQQAPKAEILPFLDQLVKVAKLDESNVPTFLKTLESASAGATGAGNVTTVVGGLGAGFDPGQHWRSVYPNAKPKKLPIIKRI